MLRDLQLKNFRCFDALALRLAPGMNFFVGGNGEGKTSILEATCILLRLQSQRTSTLAPAVQVGAKSFSLSGNYDGHLFAFRYGGLRRKLEFDGVEQRTATEYLRVARVVSFANSDIEMIRGSSETRRRYLDFVGSQMDPRYRPALRAYERALRSRNALLKLSPPRWRELAAYDPPLVAHGLQLAEIRAAIIIRLTPLVAAAHAEISESKEKVDIRYSPGNEQDFMAHLARSRAEEERLRQTVVGPHRDDIDLLVDGLSARIYASEGQQRTLALALKIGQARIFGQEGSKPLLLIDDIFGELDPARRNLLLGSLPVDSQKLVTSTTLQWPDHVGEGTIFKLEDRRIQPGHS